jgi:structure-specific endonuclease subunit SLX1
MFYVYLLLCTDGSTYIGATVNLDQRLRKHNKEIKGGAFATGAKVNQGKTWNRACHVSGFPDWPAALQFEWRWKQLSRKLSIQISPLERRMKALQQLLDLEKPTTKALAYKEWTNPPEVHLEMEETIPYLEERSFFIISPTLSSSSF